jgi:hypothetical protein
MRPEKPAPRDKITGIGGAMGMPDLKGFTRAGLVLALAWLAACSHGKNSTDEGSGPHTNIDLTVTDFTVSPGATDAEDSLHLTGTIHNIGSETANPNQGDSFQLLFNLSTDGTIEQREQGFFQQAITDPIPPGGTLNFDVHAAYGDGETQSLFGNFCSAFGCVSPQTGLIGVKVDSADVINELDEGNNFQFVNHSVVGTVVAATFGGCNFGTTDPNGPGCNFTISDGLFTVRLHRPCVNCGDASEVVFPNEIHRTVSVFLQIKGCNAVSCGGNWMVESITQKPGLPADQKQFSLPCSVAFPGTEAACGNPIVEIRSENY